MTSPAAADDSTVTPIDAAKPKKETRRQRSARESSERSATELPADSPVAENADEVPVARDITPKETRVDESTTDELTPIDEAEDVSDTDAGDADAGDADADDAHADAADAEAAEVDEAAEADAGAAAAVPAETRKQRKARQTIEDAKMEMEASEAKAAALAAKQAAEAAEKQHAIEQAATMKARVRRGAKRWFRRLALVAVVGGIGVGAYLAWPTFNERYVQPVESTAADVDNIQTNVSALQDLTATENQRLVDLINGVNASTDELAAESAAIQDTLDALASSQADLITSQANLDARLGDIETEIGNATRRIDEIGTLTTELGSTLEVTNRSAATQLTVMRATELLSRSRLLLYQANYGLAKADLTAARNALADVPQTPLLDAAIARLDLGISNLPDRPVAAAGDIDIAWAALLAGTTDAVRPDESFIPTPAEQSGDSNPTAAEQQVDDAAGDESAESETPDE